MAKLTIQITHVSWRDGRPRFEPGPQLRKEGWKGEDLRHGPVTQRPGHPPRKTGPWFSAEEALAWVAEREKAIDRRRGEIIAAKETGRRIARLKPATAAARWYSIEDLFEDWFKSPRMSGKEEIDGKRRQKVANPSTVADYRVKAKVFAAFDPELYVAAVDALSKPITFDLYERLWAKRGLATARGVIAVLSSAISWGLKKGKVRLAINPCAGLGMETPEPRLRCLTPTEVRALVATADAVGRPEIGDAIILGVWTGQRQADRLAMADGGAMEGRRVLRQRKTAAIVMIPDAPEVQARLAAMRQRRQAWKVQPIEIVVDERRHVPFQREYYSRTFGEIRAAAVAGVKDATTGAWLVEPCPSVADARDQDLRDTAVTWLARAGCTIPEICQITGHSMQSAQQTLKHYLVSHAELADNAIKKLVTWMEGQ